MNPFEYANPRSVDEAIALLAPAWGETEILAGGTDLITSMKQYITSPKRVVSLKQVKELRGIENKAGNLRIGAMTTLAELIENNDIQSAMPCLVKAVHGIGSRQIIAMGTVGGDLCQRPRCWYFRLGYGLLAQANGKPMLLGAPTSLPAAQVDGDNRYHAIFGNAGPAYFVNPSSLAPGLIALNASVTLRGPDRKDREAPVAEFFTTPKSGAEREYVLKPNEVLTHITIPATTAKNATYEVRERAGLDWPLAAAAVAFQLDNGKARKAVVALGHVAPVPWLAKAAAAALEGQTVDEAVAEKCGAAATEGAKPLSKNGYKVQLVKVAVKRAVLAAAGLTKET